MSSPHDSPSRPPSPTEPTTPEQLAAAEAALAERAQVLALAARLSEFVPFNRALGIETLEVSEGRARFRLPFRPEFIGDPVRNALHGGLIATLLDAAGGAAVWTLVRLSDRISTIDMRVDYLRPGKPEALLADGHVIRAGRHVAVVNVRAFHETAPDKTIAEARGVYSIKSAPGLQPPPPPPGRSKGSEPTLIPEEPGG